MNNFGRKQNSVVALILLVVAMFAHPQFARGQGATAALNGTVLDPAGLPIVDAHVTLVDVDTHTSLSSTTNPAGVYVFVSLVPERYSLKVEKAGFAIVSTAPFTLAVNQTLTQNVTLSVGATTQEVTVASSAVSLEPSTTELGTDIQQNQVVGLPLNGRNFTQLLELTPGVSPIDTDQSSGTGFGGHAVGTFTYPSVNGQSNRSNMFLIDGFTDYSFIGSYAVAPIMDDVEEFKVQSHNDSSAFGGVLGGIVNVVTRNGTSEYHGNVWEFIRNSAFDARNYFNTAVTPYKQNQYGGTFGGPVVPSFFRKNKNPSKAFFFAAYEGYRSNTASEGKDVIPTQAQLGGDFSSITAPIYNPFTTAPDPNKPGQYTRIAFNSNQIPSNLINSGLQAYAKLIYPAVTQLPTNGFNFVDSDPNLVGNDTGSVRGDYQFSNQLSVWGTLTKFYSPITNAASIPGIFNINNEGGYLAGGNATWSSRDGRSILGARFGRSNVNVVLGTQFPSKLTTAYQIGGFNSQFTSGFIGGRSFNVGMTIPGYTAIPEGLYEGNQIADTWEGAGDFTHLKGRHTLQMGADLNTNANTQPILYASEVYDVHQTANLESTATTGNALASYLLGLPLTGTRRNTLVELHHGWVDGLYVQDQWKANSKFQVNIGLRYDFTLWPLYGTKSDNNVYVGDTDMDTGQYILQAVPPACYTGASPCIPTVDGSLPANVMVTSHSNHSIIDNVYDNWQPRIGLSYLLTTSTVIRMGAGRYFDNWAGISQNAQNYQGSWPDTSQLIDTNLNGPFPDATTGQNPLHLGTGNAITPAPNPFTQGNTFVDPFFKDPYSIEWNLGVQQQMGNGTVLEADYVGSHSSRIDTNADRNTALYPGPGAVSARTPFSYITPTLYEKSNGNSNYNSLQAKARTLIGRDSTILGAYTWSKTIDVGCDGFFGGGTSCSIQNPYNLEAERSVAGYDLPQSLSVSFVYAVPIGKGKMLNITNPILNAVVGNWSLNGIFSTRSGVPYHASASAQISNTGNNYERPNKTCSNPYQSGGAGQLLKKSCFSVPAAYTYGTEPRNDLRTPHVTNLDTSLEKNFPWGEGPRNVQFRTDFFNTLNQVAFAAPDKTVTDSTFGLTTSTANAERQIQFSLKVNF